MLKEIHKILLHATVAQLVEQLICNQSVGGSSPLGGSLMIYPPKNFRGRCPSGQREQTVNLPAYAFGGSNPSLPTIGECSSMVEPQPSKLVMSVRSRSLALFACVAQSVEHFLGKEEVTGSSPVVGSIRHQIN